MQYLTNGVHVTRFGNPWNEVYLRVFVKPWSHNSCCMHGAFILHNRKLLNPMLNVTDIMIPIISWIYLHEIETVQVQHRLDGGHQHLFKNFNIFVTGEPAINLMEFTHTMWRYLWREKVMILSILHTPMSRQYHHRSLPIPRSLQLHGRFVPSHRYFL